MKKILTIICLFCFLQKAKSDVVQPALQYALLNYSAKLIYGYEVANKEKISTLYSGGFGIVNSFLAMDEPFSAGLEMLIEKRRYFKPHDYDGFSISSYLGIEYTNNFSCVNDVAIIPGFKFNYKYHVSENTVLEPYLGLSLPITYNLEGDGLYYLFPLATLGVRFGISKLKFK